MPEETRILVVDDEPRGVELVARCLRPLGHVETAESGEEGLERVQEGRFDLVVSDQRMPGISGVELLSRVAERDAGVGRILLTGYADLSATIDAINKGRVHAYVSKPCPPDQLRATVANVLDRVRLGRENASLLRELSERNTELEAALRSVQELTRRAVASERLSAIASMVAQIVHDFRGPLSVVCAAGRELRDGQCESEEEARDLAGQLVEEADRMTRMCAELLDLTRVSAGEPKLMTEALDDVVAGALAALSHDASLRGVHIESRLAADVRMPLDEDRLRRALLNLGYNALDAMPDGGRLEVSSRVESDRAVVSIRDTGHGVPESVREQIFEPFVSFGKPRGSGLGLAIVKKIVEEHGGRIELGKAEGQGTVFHLHFPLAAGR